LSEASTTQPPSEPERSLIAKPSARPSGRFVFQSATHGLHHQVFWFVIVNLFALLQTLAVSLLLADFALPYVGVTWHAETIAHAVGIAIPIFTSYLGHKRLTFR